MEYDSLILTATLVLKCKHVFLYKLTKKIEWNLDLSRNIVEYVKHIVIRKKVYIYILAEGPSKLGLVYSTNVVL